MKEKKILQITGRPVYPIKVGQFAWIHEENGMRRTSPVVSLTQVTKAEIQFETANTLYRLCIVTPGETEVMKHD